MSSLAVENVEGYPSPAALEPFAYRLLVWLGTKTVAETVDGYRVLKTHHAPTYYFP